MSLPFYEKVSSSNGDFFSNSFLGLCIGLCLSFLLSSMYVSANSNWSAYRARFFRSRFIKSHVRSLPHNDPWSAANEHFSVRLRVIYSPVYRHSIQLHAPAARWYFQDFTSPWHLCSRHPGLNAATKACKRRQCGTTLQLRRIDQFTGPDTEAWRRHLRVWQRLLHGLLSSGNSRTSRSGRHLGGGTSATSPRPTGTATASPVREVFFWPGTIGSGRVRRGSSRLTEPVPSECVRSGSSCELAADGLARGDIYRGQFGWHRRPAWWTVVHGLYGASGYGRRSGHIADPAGRGVRRNPFINLPTSP